MTTTVHPRATCLRTFVPIMIAVAGICYGAALAYFGPKSDITELRATQRSILEQTKQMHADLREMQNEFHKFQLWVKDNRQSSVLKLKPMAFEPEGESNDSESCRGVGIGPDHAGVLIGVQREDSRMARRADAVDRRE